MSSTELLERHGLSRDSLRTDAGMISALQVHRFLRDLTETSGDPTFCWKTGWEIDHQKYPMFTARTSRNVTLAEIFTSLAYSAENLASASSFELQIQGAYASFTSYRLYKSGPSPHADAFSIAALVSLLKRHVGKQWNPAQVSVELADLSLVPTNCGCRLVKTQLPRQGTIRFPTPWLLPAAKSGSTRTQDGADFEKAGRLIDFLSKALYEYLGDPGLTSEKAASKIDSSLRDINQSLLPRQTTLAQLISDWRKAEACQKLEHSELSIAEIGAAVGYPDATSFSRVFRRWTNMSPRDYRSSVR